MEVPVQRPVRGVMDLVLHDRDHGEAVAAEAQSAIHRVEQQLRWHNLKADGLRGGTDLPLAAARDAAVSFEGVVQSSEEAYGLVTLKLRGGVLTAPALVFWNIEKK